jgi:pimeloyl-ACP methyl ester carboxylesterase
LKIIDVGTGTPIVVVPGIQGRWEWMRPTVDALSQHCRVITFSLADEPTCGWSFRSGDGFSAYVEQVRRALDETGVRTAAICGVSYGGLIAARFAAQHQDRVSGLVLVSALPPTWKPDRRARFYLRAPWLLSPLFFVASLRMYPEIAAARSGLFSGLQAAGQHAFNALTHMLSPGRMARRVHMLESVDLGESLERVNVPTLLITGETRLDRVVPVSLTKEYLRIWPRAQHATLPRTGHLGLITRPREFANLVENFLANDVIPAVSGQQRVAEAGPIGRTKVG